MKILVAGFHQESNSFSSNYYGTSKFGVTRGAGIREKYGESSFTIIGGILSSLEKAEVETVPVVYYTAFSGGPVHRETADAFLKEVSDAYDAHAPFDGICLELHGATDLVGTEDCCGYIVERIRRHVGENVKIAVGCDLHANVTDRLWENVDVVTGYQTYPHVDQCSTGRRAAELLQKKLNGEKFVQARVRIPMIVPAEGYDTDNGPFAALTRDARELAASGKIMDFSLYQMQPWLDMPDAGSTVLVTSAQEETAAACATEMAHRLFDMREEMGIRLYSVDEVIDAAKANESEMPVILVDSADSPTAGSSSDSTCVISRLLERGEEIAVCVPIVDAEAALHAFEVGVGNEGEFFLGGTMEPRFQKRIKVRAYVKSLHDGTYTRTGRSLSRLSSAGKTAVLRIGSMDVLVFEKKATVSDPQTYRSFGIEPAQYRMVVVKSATQYKLLYRQFSTLFYPTDTPGSSSANLAAMPFRYVPRPFWPLDSIDTFDACVTFSR